MINNAVITRGVGWSLMVMSHGGSNNFNELDITRSGNLKLVELAFWYTSPTYNFRHIYV